MTTSSTPRSEPLSSQAARQPPPSLTALAQLLCLLMGHAMLLYSTSRYFQWHVCRRCAPTVLHGQCRGTSMSCCRCRCCCDASVVAIVWWSCTASAAGTSPAPRWCLLA